MTISPCAMVSAMKLVKHFVVTAIALCGTVGAPSIAAPVQGQQATTSRSLTVEHDSVHSSAEHHYNSPAERASDDRIIVEVRSEIAKDGISDGFPVAVDCDHGTVVLTGVVESADDANQASRAATRVQGVVAVKNRLSWR